MTADTPFIPTGEPDISESDIALVLNCLKSGWVSGEGPYVQQFEQALASRVERKHGIAVATGSSALDVAFASLDLEPGDEVILPTFTIIACAAAIVRAGATPVTVDCDRNTWTMRPVEVAAAIGPRTRAILLVHIYGMPVDADPILAMATAHGITVVEDAAEALGGAHKGRPCGSLGDISIFSFYANKNVATGEGGMIVTNDDRLAMRCRSLRQLSHPDSQRFRHEELSWNCKMSSLQAALGCSQLDRLDTTYKRKRRIGGWYQSRLADVELIQKPMPGTDYAENGYWSFGVVLKEAAQYEASEITERLGVQGIGTRPFFWPMHEQPALRKRGMLTGVHHPNAEWIARRGFYLPSSPQLSEPEVARVCGALCSALEGRNDCAATG